MPFVVCGSLEIEHKSNYFITYDQTFSLIITKKGAQREIKILFLHIRFCIFFRSEHETRQFCAFTFRHRQQAL